MRFPVLLALLMATTALPAQVPDTARAAQRDRVLPAEIAREIAALYNAPAALRATGPAAIGAGQTVEGDVAILNGPLTIDGEVRGRVVVINGNLLFGRSARVAGDVIVVGGTIAGQERAQISGTVSWHPEVLRYQRDGERIIPGRDRAEVPEIFDWRLSPGEDDQWRSRILIMSGGTYTRVEGLPVLIGPSLRFQSDYARMSVDVLGIMRSAQGFRWDGENLGHDVRARVRIGDTRGLSIGGRLTDVIRPVEDWQLSDSEVGLASFLVRRDYRDYYNTHGASASVTLHASEATALELEYSGERWGSRSSRDPFSLFRRNTEWRANSEMDAGSYRIGSVRLSVDSRNERAHPRTGWLIAAEVERGSSGSARLGGGHDVASVWDELPEDRVVNTSYTRGFLDLRRYNRVSPSGQLNLRAVAGGWLGGDDLPLQRRLSLGGAGSLPGYNFRRPVGEDVLTCGGAALEGSPALCERVILAQVEYRGDLHFQWRRDRDWGIDVDWPAAWVLFMDTGRGWLVESGVDDGIRYSSDDLPPLGTFRLDIGGGLDLGWIGLFVAKSVSDAEQPANFFLRLRHRF